ncbi:hypothetical protein FA014_01935 [Cellulomonas hominis]|uniref:Uncharacterized protein n=1 Tax=Cellulomonas hominis TaxID=156981 RepID=A0A7Z8K1P7_9CELL|nr:hypothetical protein [Cellulomonas hominis]TKR27140.1 hypothetical protein FA014_01935 [Cellulomonas hominis]
MRTTVHWPARTPGMPMRLSRLRFIDGDAGSSGTAGSTDAGSDSGARTGTPDAGPAASPGATGREQQPAPGDGLPDDPAELRALVASLRQGDEPARTAAAQQAADEARSTLTQEIGRAIGLITDDGGSPSVEQLTTELQTVRDGSAAKDTRISDLAVRLAVYETAGQHGGDPAALTDSRAFLAKVAALDPGAEDFATKVADAAKAAVTGNQTLRARVAAPRSGRDLTGGTGERTGRPTSIHDAIERQSH